MTEVVPFSDDEGSKSAGLTKGAFGRRGHEKLEHGKQGARGPLKAFRLFPRERLSNRPDVVTEATCRSTGCNPSVYCDFGGRLAIDICVRRESHHLKRLSCASTVPEI
jgi:hypothetical protein